MKKIFTFLFALTLLFLSWNNGMAQSGYCIPSYSSGCIYGDGLVSFSLQQISQTISCSGSPSYYHFYNLDNAVLQTGTNYTVTVQAGYSSTYVDIWIDYNRNGVFDASELVAQIICGSSYTNYTATINIPTASAVSGATMLRTKTEWISYPSSACSAQSYGNCCDFPVSITPYCIPPYTYGCTYGDGLTNFTLNTINQNITCTTIPIAYYHDWTNSAAGTTSMVQGTPYTLTVTAGYSSTHVRVWVDLNNNNVFESGEILVSDFVCNSGGVPYSTTITIPGGTSVGNHTLRYRTEWVGTPTDPCANLTYGNSGDFTINVLPAAPAVITTAATGVGPDGATMNGTVNANGFSSTVSFQYGLTTAYGTTVAGVPSPVTGNSPQTVSAAINGLPAGTMYHYRVVATNINGTSYGDDMTFTTLYIAPTAVTTAATNVAAYTATINGTVTANNLSSNISFEWGTTNAYGNTIAALPGTATGMTPVNVSASLNSLNLNVTYHYRVDATNAAGTTYGNDMTFTTYCPTVGSPGTILGDAAVCQGTSGHIYSCDPINNAIAYMWTVPAGASITNGANTNAITVSFNNTAVSGNISVYGTNICSNGPTSTFAVTVNTPPSPTILGPSLPCQGVNSTYTTQNGQSGYIWTVSAGGQIVSGQGTSALTVLWNSTGAQNVSVNYANANGCYAFNPFVYNVTVQAAPVPTVSGISEMCVNSGFYNYTTEAGKSGYIWTISSGGTITYGQGTDEIQVTWNQSGPQNVSVNYQSSAGCYAINPTTYNVTVDPMPDAAGSISGTSSVCAGATGVAYYVAPINHADNYVWSLPAGATISSGDGTNSITVDFSASAVSGNITVYGNNLCGDGAVSPPYAVTVTAIPGNPGSITGPSTICQGSTGIIYSVPAVTGATSYIWTVLAGAEIVAGQGTNSITVNFSSSASSGNISVSASNSCGTGPSSTKTITLLSVPAAPVISLVDNMLHSSVADGNQWYLDGTSISGATAQDYTPVATGSYWDVVTVGICTSDTSNHIYYVMLGIAPVADNSFEIYPVPNDGSFKLAVRSSVPDNYTLEIYNNLGVRIYQMKNLAVNGTSTLSVDMRPVPSGIYTAVLRNSNNEVVKKFLVTR